MAVLLPKAERAEKAMDDLELYSKMMKGGNTHGCLLIEREWELDGLPPNLVMTVLHAAGAGKTVAKAMSELGM